MAWDKNFPTDATKIRLDPAGVRGNWAAIEAGNVPYVRIQLAKQTTDPTRQNNTGWVYGKQVSSQTELFFEDDRNPAKVTQLTNNNRIGVITQGVNASNFIMDATSFSFGINQMIVATGSYNSSGVLTSGVNMSTHATPHPSTGIYNIRVNADVLLNNNYKVQLTSFTTGNERIINIVSKGSVTAGNPTTIQVQITSGAGSGRDEAFEVIIIGGR
jgi:hypothetical protein